MIKKIVALFILFCTFQVKAQVTRDSLDNLFNKADTSQVSFNTKFTLIQNILKLAESKKDTAYTIKSLQKLGDLLWFNGAYSRSEEYYYKSLHLANANKYSQQYAYALYSIGWIECVQKKNINRIYLLKKALGLYKKINDKFGVVSVYNALSGVYNSLAAENNNAQNIDSSIRYLEQAIDFCRKDEKLSQNTENLSSNLAEQYIFKKDFSKANAIITELLNSKKIKKNKHIYTQSIVIKSEIYYATNKIDSCLALLNSQLQEIEKYSYDEVLKDAYNYLYLCYNAKKNYAFALKYFEKYYEIDEKINKELQSNRYEEIEANYKLLKKEKKISDLTKKNELFQIKEQQRLYSLLGALLVILLVSAFLVNMLRKNKKIKLLHQNISLQKELIETKHEEIQDSIVYAKRIQDAILPSATDFQEKLPNAFVFFQPKDIVSGDFYWIEKVENAVYFATADCTGHGVPGAMVSLVCSSALSKVLLEEKIMDTGKILNRVRELVIERFENDNEDVKDGMDISLCRLEGNHLQWSGANNQLWIIQPASKTIEEIKADKQPIGKSFNQMPFTSHSMTLQKGTFLYVFTDGFADQFGGELNKKYMYKSFKNLLIQLQNNKMEVQKKQLKETFDQWKGNNEQTDDVCIIGVKIA